MTRKPDIAIEIAREMARQLDAGKSFSEAAAVIPKVFPTATAADVERAGLIYYDELEMVLEQREEANTDTAFAKSICETLFPKPDKT
jgi:type II secretory pathway component PulF